MEILCSYSLAAEDDDDDDDVLHIGGIFPIGGEGGWQGGQVSFNLMIVFNALITNVNCLDTN